MSSQIEIKPSLQSLQYVDDVISEELKADKDNTTHRDYYIKLMDQVEIDGFPKNKISTIGK